MKLKGIYIAECKDKYGNWKWTEKAENYVTDTGIKQLLGVGLTTTLSVVSDWYVGLVAGPAGAAGITSSDAMASVAWSESTVYAEDTRPEWVKTLGANYVSNTAAKATFTLEADGTSIDGAFLCSSKTAGGTSGILMSVAAFGTPKVGDSGDKLEVSYKIVGSDDTSS